MSKGGWECDTVDRTGWGCGSAIVWRECEAAVQASAGMRWFAKGERVRSRTVVWLALECKFKFLTPERVIKNYSKTIMLLTLFLKRWPVGQLVTFRMFRIAYEYISGQESVDISFQGLLFQVIKYRLVLTDVGMY